MDGLPPSAWLSALPGLLFPGGANLLMHSTVIIAVGLMAFRLLKPKGAALQSLILRVTLAGVLVSPVVTIAVSEIGIKGLTIPVPQRYLTPGAVVKSFEGKGMQVSPVRRDDSVLPTVARDVPKKREPLAVIADRRGLGFPAMFQNACRLVPIMIPGVVAAWLLLSAVLFARFLFSTVRIARIRNSAVAAGEDVTRRCAVLAEQMGVRIPPVFESPFVGSPFLTGIVRPAILLPESGGREDMIGDDVLLHELAHLARGDCFWNMLGKFGNAIVPFQPLLRLLQRKIDETSDLVCDDYVLKYSHDPHAYACRLFDIADRFHRSPALYASVVSLVSFNSSLGRRIERILDTTRAISIGTGAHSVIRVGSLCLVLIVLLGFTGFRTMRASERPDEASYTTITAPAVPTAVRFPALSVISDAGSQTELPFTVLLGDEGVARADHPEINTVAARQAEKIIVSAVGSDTNTTHVAKAPVVPPEKPAIRSVAADKETSAIVHTETYAEYIEAVPVSTAPAPVAESPWRNTASPNAGPALAVATSLPPEPKAAAPAVEPKAVFHPAIPAKRDECLREGRKYMEIGDYAAAEELFLAALSKKSRDPETLCELGKSSFMNRNNERAIIFLKTAIAQNPRYAEAHYTLGDVYLAKGELDEAMKHHKAAIQLNPGYERRARSYY